MAGGNNPTVMSCTGRNAGQQRRHRGGNSTARASTRLLSVTAIERPINMSRM
jgi:hypothetical protein